MIDRFFYWFFGVIDKLTAPLEEKPRKKIKRIYRCKDCGCKCHCQLDLHNHWWDGEPCVCEGCKH